MDNNKSEIPRPENPDSLESQFMAFVEIVKILREKCPWDKKQTHQSISHLLIEETYEMIDAVNKRNDDEFAKELGDLFLHVVMHGIMAEQRGAFNLIDVLTKISQKLVYRHPHVFGNVDVENEDDVMQNWEALKMKEGQKSVLQGVPLALPSLLRAERIQHKASRVGFDWDNKEDVWAKVEEELAELKHELKEKNISGAEEELGDLLFAIVNAARFEDIVPETALQHANNKFTRRFQYIEKRAAELKRNLNDMTLAEMDELWEEAKSEEIKPLNSL